MDYNPKVAEAYMKPLTKLQAMAGKEVDKGSVPFTNAPFIALKRSGMISDAVDGRVTISKGIKNVTSDMLAAEVRKYWHSIGKKVTKRRKYVRKDVQGNVAAPAADMVLHNAVAEMVSLQIKIEKRLDAIESYCFRHEAYLNKKEEGR